MARDARGRELLIGVTVVVGLALLAAAILFVGQESRLFAPKIHFSTNVADASGLRVGSPVTIAGVRVGTVSGVALPTDPQAAGIEIGLSVDRAYAARAREGTVAKLVMLQFVANEKSIDLTPGDPAKPVLADGAFIPTEQDQPLLETGRTIADTVQVITTDLKEVLGAIRRGDGLVGKAIVDPSFGSEGVEHLNDALTSLSEILAGMQRGEGLIGQLVQDRARSQKIVDDLGKTTAALAVVAERIERGEGLAGKLAAPGGEGTVLEDVRAIASTLRSVAEGLDQGQGLAGQLLRDNDLSARVTKNLDEATARLASITKKIDEGQGTLGLLVNERTLHDDVETLITGVEESRIASWLIHRYYRKGQRVQERGTGEKDQGGTPGGDKSYSAPSAGPSEGLARSIETHPEAVP